MKKSIHCFLILTFATLHISSISAKYLTAKLALGAGSVFAVTVGMVVRHIQKNLRITQTLTSLINKRSNDLVRSQSDVKKN